MIIDFYEELLQLLKSYNDTNNPQDNESINTITECLQMVRNPKLHPIYQPPLTAAIMDNAKIISISTLFLQLQEVSF